jgi:hypothetical protein
MSTESIASPSDGIACSPRAIASRNDIHGPGNRVANLHDAGGHGAEATDLAAGLDRQQFGERRLPRSVCAQQAHHFSRFYAEIEPVNNLRCTKCLV